MPSLLVTLTKRRTVVRIPITVSEQITAGKRNLPANAHTLTGVNAFAQRRTGTFAPLLPVFLYGASATMPAATALTQGVLVLATAGAPATAQFTQDAGADQYIYYAYPAQLPTPSFHYMGFTGGFIEVGSVYGTITTGNGTQPVTQAIPFRIWRSVTPNLGAGVVLTVTH